jgi:hypothetical protein
VQSISFRRPEHRAGCENTRFFETLMSRLLASLLTFFLFFPHDSLPAVNASGQAIQASSVLCSAAEICDVCSALGHSDGKKLLAPIASLVFVEVK